MTEELASVIARQKDAFVKEHGRLPRADESLTDQPYELVEHAVVEGLKSVGAHPSLIYAYEKTGLIVTESSKSMVPTKDLNDYNSAIDEWHSLHPKESRSTPDSAGAKRKQYYVDYEVTYKGRVGPFTTEEIDGFIDLEPDDEKIDKAIDKNNLTEYWNEATTSYHCQKCDEMVTFASDDDNMIAKFTCDCDFA